MAVAVVLLLSTSFCLDFDREEQMKEEILELKNRVAFLTSQITLCARSYRSHFDMIHHDLKNQKVTCNDGTPAGLVYLCQFC